MRVTSTCAVSSWDCPGGAELLLHLPTMSEPTRGALGLLVEGSGWCSGAEGACPQHPAPGLGALSAPRAALPAPGDRGGSQRCHLSLLLSLPVFSFPVSQGRPRWGQSQPGPPQRAERLCLQLAHPDTTAQRAARALGNAGRSQQWPLALPAHFWHACAVW